MAKYKNIRIKMKGGKTRLQRVKVLASGKFKFVKNIRKSLSRRKPRRTKTRKRSVRRMARRKKNRGGGGKSITRTAFKFIRLGALLANPVRIAMEPGISGSDKVRHIFGDYTGYDIVTGTFDAQRLARGWGPYLMACVATYGIPKLTSIIRRI